MRSACIPRRQAVFVRAEYSFADISRKPGRSYQLTSDIKYQARQSLALAVRLCDLKQKQLAALPNAYLLDVHKDAVAIANRLPKSNPARRRQENYVAKMLRTHLTQPELDTLQEYLELLQNHTSLVSLTPTLPETRSLQEHWLSGILQGDQETTTEVISVFKENGLDYQLLLQRLRQIQETKQPKPAAVGVGDSSANIEVNSTLVPVSSLSSAPDSELMQLLEQQLLEAACKVQPQGTTENP